MQQESFLSSLVSSGNSEDSIPLADLRGGVDSRLSSFASRVFDQVFSARALETQLDCSFSDVVGNDDFANDDSSDKYDSDNHLAMNSEATASLAPSMSISSIARTERLLQKNVPIVNAGRHILLTKEDMERIRDKELLRFLEANSAMFVKYFQQNGEGAAAGPVVATEMEKPVDIEREIEDLATRIDTFITAFDNDGEEYHIYVGEDSRLLVPVGAGGEEDTCDPAGWSDGGGIDVCGEDWEVESGVVSFTAASDTRNAIVTDEVAKEKGGAVNEQGKLMEAPAPSLAEGTEGSNTTLGVVRLGRRVRLESQPPPLPPPLPSSPPKTLPRGQEKGQHPHAKKKPTMGPRKRLAVGEKRPSPKVRGVKLTAEQNDRIQAMMHIDFIAEPSPYTSSVERLAALNERLRWMQRVRGENGDRNKDNKDDDDDELDLTVVDAGTSGLPEKEQQGHRRTANELGNSYMHEARKQRLQYARMHAINLRLSQLHDTHHMEALCPKEGVEQLVGAPRPAWSRDMPPPPTTAEIAVLVENARRENALALELGEKPEPSSEDKQLLYLHEKVRLALCNAESLFPSA